MSWHKFALMRTVYVVVKKNYIFMIHQVEINIYQFRQKSPWPCKVKDFHNEVLEAAGRMRPKAECLLPPPTQSWVLAFIPDILSVNVFQLAMKEVRTWWDAVDLRQWLRRLLIWLASRSSTEHPCLTDKAGASQLRSKFMESSGSIKRVATMCRSKRAVVV